MSDMVKLGKVKLGKVTLRLDEFGCLWVSFHEERLDVFS